MYMKFGSVGVRKEQNSAISFFRREKSKGDCLRTQKTRKRLQD